MVIPAWNAARYLREAVEGVRAEVPDAEILVVDDGSTDETARLDLGPVRRLGQAHAGVAAARKLGVAEARGELLAFCDADDLWVSGRMAPMLDALAEAPEQVVLGQLEEFLSPELPAGSRVARPGRFPGWVCGAMLLRRETFLRIGPFDPQLQLGDHVEWLARARARGTRMLPELVLRRRVHLHNLTAGPRQGYVAMARALLRKPPPG